MGALPDWDYLPHACRLLGSPYITAAPSDLAPGSAQLPAAVAAAELAGEWLPARLLHLLYALAGNSWASWLQGVAGWAGCLPAFLPPMCAALLCAVLLPSRLTPAIVACVLRSPALPLLGA